MLFLKAFLLMKPPFWKKLVGLAKVIQNASETFFTGCLSLVALDWFWENHAFWWKIN